MKSLYAALVFFTRLPFWRLYNPPAEAFKSIVNYWWFAGIITGGIMAAGFFAAAHLFPALIAAIVAVVLRLLATGALHARMVWQTSATALGEAPPESAYLQ